MGFFQKIVILWIITRVSADVLWLDKLKVSDYNEYIVDESTTEWATVTSTTELPDSTTVATTTEPTESPITCNSTGFFCGGCGTSYYCVPLGNNQFVPEKVQDCPIGSSCLQSTGECSRDANPDCGQNNFQCHQLGMFPDPVHCNAFHICYGNSTPKFGICQDGFVYNALTALCKKANSCQRPVPECQSMGQSGPVLGHPKMYYVCLPSEGGIFAPHLYLCPGNDEYVDDACRDASPEVGVDQNGVCLKVGKFYNSVSCRLYDDCESVGEKAETKECPEDMIFNHRKKECEEFKCCTV